MLEKWTHKRIISNISFRNKLQMVGSICIYIQKNEKWIIINKSITKCKGIFFNIFYRCGWILFIDIKQHLCEIKKWSTNCIVEVIDMSFISLTSKTRCARGASPIVLAHVSWLLTSRLTSLKSYTQSYNLWICIDCEFSSSDSI